MARTPMPVYLPDDVRRRLEAEARRLEMSLSLVAVVYLDRSLPRLDGSPEPDEPAPLPPPLPAEGGPLDFD